ncbi:diguanylate cyclase domain-containing protein [Cognatilysobacter tabacisoli]|uniref:diguanylate cyclase domain-containing protein n=1 Tax=Cognatilysobacter tabacisoli TaxID=2315424 RepID=UPI000E6B32F6|nr:diguanylate cyclase [Lysobacter tabacisoli]
MRPADSADAEPQHEITRLQAELSAVRARLRASELTAERNHLALCAIADGIAIVDNDGRLTCLNPVASHLSGWKEGECLGRPLASVLNFTDHQGRAIDVVADGFSSSDPEAIVTLGRRDGHAILVDGAVAPVHDRRHRRIGAVVTFRNVTASTRLARELAYHANHDPLTGLHNRRAFLSQLERAIGHAAQFGTCNALLYLDLDRFKAVNDLGGHLAGDELLRQLAVLLRRQLRERDTVARLGGDEFAVLLENCTSAHATTVAEKIRKAVIEFAFAWDGGQFRIGTSIGQVDFDTGALSVDELIAAADRMCYVAKDTGRNCVAIHGPDSHRILPAGHSVSHRPGARRVDEDAER